VPRIRPALALALLPLTTACAAVPAERLGSVPPHSPVTAQEAAKAYPIDVYDPLEGLNRRVYRFNTTFDRWVFLPVAGGYQRVVPDPVRQGVANFFRNLGEFRNGLNGALQARPAVFGTAVGRLVVNSTVGVLGLFDVATKYGLPEHREDFGQTLGRWGVPPGAYLVLPILGPSDVRDAGGTAADTAATGAIPGVSTVFDTVYFDPAVYGLYAVDQRAQIPFRYYRSGSAFEYDLVRFLFTQKRKLDVAK
jgi:phospholipid-binding lipoprotein MlaA